MVDIIGRAKVIVESQIDKSSIDQTGGKIGRGLKAGAVVGVAALGTVAAASFKMYQSFETAEAQSRKLNQVLDNMGESKAGPAVEDLATKLSRLTGVEDEVIQQGQTVLATFSEVAESAGEMGGTFERATKLSLDLAATMGGDVSGASRQLGKALQDPVKGVTALTRMGVTFTAAQKEVIKSLVETGDVAGAQALILAEVERQVGGTAEASATNSQKIQTAMSEAGEALGNVLDTLAGGKNPADDGKGLSTQIDDVTDSLNEFADSEGLKEFSRELGEINQDLQDGDTFLGTWSDSVDTMALSLLDLPGIFNDVRGKFGDLKADIEDGGLFDGVSNSLEDAEKDLGRGLRNMKTKIGDTIDDIQETAGEWRAAGRKLITNFWEGVKTKVSGSVGDIVQGLKDALNSSLGLPRTINIPLAPDIRIPAFAGGVRNFGGGLAEVGERGRELVYLPPGSDVYSNSESNRMLAGAGGAATVNNWNFYGPESLSAARREADWYNNYGTRFGAATAGAAL